MSYSRLAKVKPYNFDRHTCFFCLRFGPDLRTGYLPIDGKIWQCGNCRKEYQREKTRQARYRPKMVKLVIERMQ